MALLNASAAYHKQTISAYRSRKFRAYVKHILRVSRKILRSLEIGHLHSKWRTMIISAELDGERSH